MNHEIQQADLFLSLLKEFQTKPKRKNEPTYLEICRYPGSRFEEICSRFLAFFLDPNNDHGFGNLFLESLFQLLLVPKDFQYINEQIQVVAEENADGKRLDILVKSSELIIGIENKINAKVYNPLELYSRQVDRYKKANVFKIVLSVRKIVSQQEHEKIRLNNFVIIYYSQFLNQIKLNIGTYISQCNSKYLTFLYDFIQTIENMTGETLNNNPLTNFFTNNIEGLDELVNAYSRYKDNTLRIQKEKISQIMALIKVKTADLKWWAYKDWDLGYDDFYIGTGKPRIGIEASFEQVGSNPLAKFRVYITTWSLRDFVPYEDVLVEHYPGRFIDKMQGNRVYLHVDVVLGDDEQGIIEKLFETYLTLQQVVLELPSTSL